MIGNSFTEIYTLYINLWCFDKKTSAGHSLPYTFYTNTNMAKDLYISWSITQHQVHLLWLQLENQMLLLSNTRNWDRRGEG